MPGKFETLRPPTACGTDNHALLLGCLGACLRKRATAPRRIGHHSIPERNGISTCRRTQRGFSCDDGISFARLECTVTRIPRAYDFT